MGSTPDVGRRDLIKRSAALGLIAVPTMSFLSACASGGGDDDDKVDKGKKRQGEPAGVNRSAPLDVVIFDGGFGTSTPRTPRRIYKKGSPRPRSSSPRPRRSRPAPAALQRGHPAGPGRQLRRRADGHGRPGRQEAARRPHPAAGRAVPRRPEQEGPRHAAPRHRRDGPVRRRSRCGSLYYAYTVYGVWYSKRLWTSSTRSTRRPGTTCSRSARRRRRRASRAGRTRASTRTTCRSRSTPSSPRSAAGSVLDAIDNLEPNAWKNPAVKAAFEAYYELYKKGYILKGTPGLDHIESQTAWNEGKALFIPNGSWVENEAKKTTPKDFKMAVAAPSGLDKSRQDAVRHPLGLRRRAVHRAREGQEPRRAAWSCCASCSARSPRKNFTQQVTSLTAFNGGTEGLTLPPGLAVRAAGAGQGGQERRQPAPPGLVRGAPEGEDRRGRLGEMMAGRITPAEAIKKVQKYADEAAKDDSIKHYKHQTEAHLSTDASPAAAPRGKSGGR